MVMVMLIFCSEALIVAMYTAHRDITLLGGLRQQTARTGPRVWPGAEDSCPETQVCTEALQEQV